MSRLFSVEKAKSGRSSCKGCESKISKNELRIGIMTQQSGSDWAKWYHLECFSERIRKKPTNPGDIIGYSELSKKEKNKILAEIFADGESEQESESEEEQEQEQESEKEEEEEEDSEPETKNQKRIKHRAKKNSRKRKRTEIESSESDTEESEESEDSNYNSNSSRTRNSNTKNKLKAPPLKRSRIRASDVLEMKVAELKLHLKQNDLSASGRKVELQERLKKFIAKPKKTKAEQKLLRQKIAKDKERWTKIREAYSGCTVAALKDELKGNNMKRTGNKPELLDRVAGCKLWGCLPRCPECGSTNLTVKYAQKFGHDGQGSWKCPGYWDDDEFVRCSFKSDDKIDRPKWK